MRVTSFIVAIGLLISSAIAQAEIFADGSGIEGNNYFGVMLASPQYKEDDSNTDFRGTGLIARGGREFFKYFAVEGHFGIFSGDTVNDTTYQIDYMGSLFARGNLFLFDDRARAYALVGLTYFAGDVPRFKGDDDIAPAFGLGLELYGNERNAITLEAMRYADGDLHNVDYKIDSINVGYQHRF
ncbi:MAG: hypothetical protein B6D70_08645 [gamma proteobacterium symbiont of Stewartia floridana]|nr:porin family protein [Candidatus Thiodiazotropha taylori]MCG7962932.1 porin family protein [Candidatus Thiodiazotropha endolucinida]RLW54697.1 MAG: hypothetical protein B6D76_06325 [gamma proteobacterium symbiont of Stewartia floridana]MCG7866143.1 porin family protein [Candidatus Thiodiazotropha taylori]MCG7895230.1 porin family protein [Candidatus Thiodiazotropha taylori]